MGHGRVWPAGCWHSRSTPSSGNALAFGRLRFVPQPDVVAPFFALGRVDLWAPDAATHEACSTSLGLFVLCRQVPMMLGQARNPNQSQMTNPSV
jgi:hypothetical protein